MWGHDITYFTKGPFKVQTEISTSLLKEHLLNICCTSRCELVILLNKYMKDSAYFYKSFII